MRLFLLSIFACILCFGADKILVVTGIPAQNEAVTEIGAGFVTVQSLLPPGASPETYYPTPRQLAICSKAQLFLSIRTPMEKAVLTKIRSSFPNMKVWDTTLGMVFREIDGGEAHGHGDDPHVWLGVGNMKAHAINVAKALESACPTRAAEIKSNLETYLGKLDKLESRINDILKPHQGETILVYHPAFGYLLDSANMKQLAVEQHGRDASARHLAKLSREARRLRCRKLFVQPQSNPVSASKAASTLGKEKCILSPIPENYTSDMLDLARAISSAF